VFLYSYAGQPWKTQELVHRIMQSQYGNQPNSLSGNDDCGQMSAWYIFNALGFYPVCPASNYYVFGSPSLERAVIHLSNGKTFAVNAKNLSEHNFYIQSIRLNNKDWNSPYLPYDELKNGGTLSFTMGSEPNKKWGVAASVPR